MDAKSFLSLCKGQKHSKGGGMTRSVLKQILAENIRFAGQQADKRYEGSSEVKRRVGREDYITTHELGYYRGILNALTMIQRKIKALED